MNKLPSLKKHFCFGLFIAIFQIQVQAAAETIKNPVKIKAPNWSLRDIENNSNTLSANKGKVVVLNFWGTFCTPCLKEIPDLVAIQQHYAGRVAVIGAAMDKNSDAKVKRFAKKYSINYPVFMAPGSLLNDYNVMFAPVTFIIDKEGFIVFKQAGAANREAIERLIAPML
jgi:thiol-disulfide isomerase/thioredoxin